MMFCIISLLPLLSFLPIYFLLVWVILSIDVCDEEFLLHVQVSGTLKNHPVQIFSLTLELFELSSTLACYTAKLSNFINLYCYSYFLSFIYFVISWILFENAYLFRSFSSESFASTFLYFARRSS